MTLDWKKFNDEVPTEPRSVLCGGWGNEMIIMIPFAFVDGEWVSDDEVGGVQTASEWREEAGDREVAHWAYVDPPEEA